MSQNVLSKIPASVCAGATLAGLVLIALIVVLPERMQSGAVCGGVALTLGGIAASLADKSWLHWKKLSPASAILLGAVLVGASAFWHGGEDSPFASLPRPSTWAAARTVAPVESAQAQLSASSATLAPSGAASERAAAASAPHPMGGGSLAGPLVQLAALLDQKVQGALDRQLRLATALMRNEGRVLISNPDAFRAELDAAGRDLADAESSLATLKGQHHAVLPELEVIVGDSQPLAELTAGLNTLQAQLVQVNDVESLAAAFPAIRRLAQQQRTSTAAAQQWLVSCRQRLAEASMPGGAHG
jgi:hypothetical protein